MFFFFHLKALKSTISKTFVREKEIPISQLCNCITFKVVSLRSDVRDGPKNLRTCFGSDFNKSPTDLVTEMFLNLKHKTAMKMWKKNRASARAICHLLHHNNEVIPLCRPFRDEKCIYNYHEKNLLIEYKA